MYLLGGSEDIRQQEVEQRPELVQIVLQRGSRQQQSVLRVQHTHSGTELARLVLQTVRLVDDQVMPGDLGQGGLLQVHDFVSGDHHVPFTLSGAARGLQKLGGDLRALFLGAVESNEINGKEQYIKYQ